MASEPELEDVAARLIGELELEAEIIDEGKFTLDRDQALAKLAAHRLADPAAWLLMMVRIGHLGGTRLVDIMLDSSATLVSLSDVVLPESWLVDPLAALFEGAAEQDERERRMQRLLAVVFLELLSSEPDSIELTSCDPQGLGVRLRHERGVKPDTLEHGIEGPPGVRLVVQHAERSRVAEQDYLRAGCAHSRLPIRLDGGRIEASSQHGVKKFADGVATQPILDGDGRTIGVAGWIDGAQVDDAESDPAQLAILVEGVKIESLPLSDLRPGGLAIVEVDMRLDLAQTRVIRDEAFTALVERARAALQALPEPDRRSPRPVLLAPPQPDPLAELSKSTWKWLLASPVVQRRLGLALMPAGVLVLGVGLRSFSLGIGLLGLAVIAISCVLLLSTYRSFFEVIRNMAALAAMFYLMIAVVHPPEVRLMSGSTDSLGHALVAFGVAVGFAIPAYFAERLSAVVDPRRPPLEVIERAAAALRAGKLIAFPTETVYELAARARDETAVAKIFAAKNRPSHLPSIVSVLGAEQARELVSEWPPLAQALVDRFWPGPLTLVLPKPTFGSGGLSSVAVQAPAHPVERALLVALGEPIMASSANLHREIPSTTAREVRQAFGFGPIAYLIDGGQTPIGIESTILDLCGEQPVLVRPGSITADQLEPITGPLARVEVPTEQEARRYAPPELLELVDRDTIVTRGQRGGSVTAVLIEPAWPIEGVLHLKILPADPAGYARLIYATLHSLQGLPHASILVERVPADPTWDAVRDRLQRAAILPDVPR